MSSTSGLSISIHGIIALPDATSYEKMIIKNQNAFYTLLQAILCLLRSDLWPETYD